MSKRRFCGPDFHDTVMLHCIRECRPQRFRLFENPASLRNANYAQAARKSGLPDFRNVMGRKSGKPDFRNVMGRKWSKPDLRVLWTVSKPSPRRHAFFIDRRDSPHAANRKSLCRAWRNC
jgi:hypothetical protein